MSPDLSKSLTDLALAAIPFLIWLMREYMRSRAVTHPSVDVVNQLNDHEKRITELESSTSNDRKGEA